MFKRLFKTKTFWVSIGGILTVVGSMVGGVQTLEAGLLEIFALVLAITFRDALAKKDE